MVFQLAAKGLSVCCCMDVISAQVGLETASLNGGAATDGLEALAALADGAGFVVWAKPGVAKTTSVVRTRPNDSSWNHNAAVRRDSINDA